MDTFHTLKITFLPENRHVHVLPGTSILEAAGRANIIIETPCGGRGTCGKCRVRVAKNPPEPNAAEKGRLSQEELDQGFRLACQAEIRTDMIIEVPAASRFLGQRILAHGIETVCELDPAVALDPQDPVGRLYGAAFDVGTTTIVGALLDLAKGEQLTSASRANPQILLGDDVIARIGHAGNDGGLKELQALVVGCVNEMIDEMCSRMGVGVESVYEVSIVGNTTMNHIVLGIDPTPLAHAPYEAVLVDSRLAPAKDIGLRIRPTGNLYTMANIAGYVGGDTVGVILASGVHEHDGVRLALDIGTNGEIVLGGRKRLVACSTAAGPAFEGARIRQGMRATKGAIEKVVIDDDVRVNVIGSHAPRGICGTGVIDAVAALLAAGVVDPTGRMLPPEDAPRALPDGVKRRIVERDGQLAFELTTAEQSPDGPVRLTQRDVREVQLGKGAILAGTQIILREYGVTHEDVDRILLAGAFGNFVRAPSALRVGLLPAVPREKVEFIGNAAGTGAKMVLAGQSCRAQAEAIAKSTEYIELAGRADFQTEFAAGMIFPES